MKNVKKGTGIFEPLAGRRAAKSLPVPFLLVALSSACGVKGPPLPPLVRVPAAPGDLTAERRGDRVDLRFVVPAANTDGSRPANIERVDIYALTAPTNVSDEVLLKRGTRIASVEVKAPRDPDETVEPGDPISDVEPPQGSGLDQGALADVHEVLTSAAMQPVEVTGTPSGAGLVRPGALVGPVGAPSRTFVGVGVSTRGRRGAISRRAVVTLAPVPPAPVQPTVTYDETTLKVTWMPAAAAAPEKAASSGDVLPSTTFGIPTPATAYHLYEVTPPTSGSGSARTAQGKLPAAAPETRLTKSPITEREFADKRIEWGVERCYTVRVVWTFGESSVESDAAPPGCTTPTDTFAPVTPSGLTPIPSEGAVTLIWNPNTEGDLAGYIVLRASVPAGVLMPLTPVPIQLTTFRDTVPRGARFAYAVKAIDKAGNASPESARVEEAAR